MSAWPDDSAAAEERRNIDRRRQIVGRDRRSFQPGRSDSGRVEFSQNLGGAIFEIDRVRSVQQIVHLGVHPHRERGSGETANIAD